MSNPMTEISRDSAIPLYQQIKQNLLHDIQSGVLEFNTRLSSERKLTEEYGVSRITVRQALTELVQEGYLYTKPSKGFYVAEQTQPYELNVLLSFSSSARERGLVPSSKILESSITPATSALSRQLLIGLGSEVVSLVRLRYIDDLPVRIEHVWLPHGRCPGVLDYDLGGGSLYAVLSEKYELTMTRAETSISAQIASAQEQELLDLSYPDAVVTVDQLTYAQDDRPIELSLMVIHPRRYPLSLVQEEGEFTLRPVRRS
jgi:GntR family transcriptional regulator